MRYKAGDTVLVTIPHLSNWKNIKASVVNGEEFTSLGKKMIRLILKQKVETIYIIGMEVCINVGHIKLAKERKHHFPDWL